jgi:hypothetical protein
MTCSSAVISSCCVCSIFAITVVADDFRLSDKFFLCIFQLFVCHILVLQTRKKQALRPDQRLNLIAVVFGNLFLSKLAAKCTNAVFY